MTDFAGVQHVYTYDANGNILSDTYGGYTVSYAYDSLNRMTRYNDPVYGWTYVYVYDDRGNIVEMQEHYYTTGTLGDPHSVFEYEYNDSIWADLMTAYDGVSITYDEIGNPLNWIWGETLTWQNGRQLASYDGTVNYTYTADGLRTSKSGARNTEYYIVNGQYIGESTTIGNTTYLISYFYDENGSPAGIYIDDAVYYFVKNLQGDVTALVDYTGAVVAKYTYDAWGSIVAVTDGNGASVSSTHVAHLNPFRYRGYMYDEETGFYYLRSRYYDPYIGRFINSDNVISGISDSTNGYNPFTYCFNNPVNLSDESGNWPKWLEKAAKAVAVIATVATAVAVVTIATAGTGGLALAAAGVAFATSCGGLVGGIANESKNESFINGWLGGATSGFIQSSSTVAMATIGLGAVGTIVGGSLGSGLGTAITETLNNNDKPQEQRKSAEDIFNNSLNAAAISVVMCTITAGVQYGIDYAQGSSGYNSWADSLSSGEGIAPITSGFGEMLKGFFGSIDDALVYFFCD